MSYEKDEEERIDRAIRVLLLRSEKELKAHIQDSIAASVRSVGVNDPESFAKVRGILFEKFGLYSKAGTMWSIQRCENTDSEYDCWWYFYIPISKNIKKKTLESKISNIDILADHMITRILEGIIRAQDCKDGSISYFNQLEISNSASWHAASDLLRDVYGISRVYLDDFNMFSPQRGENYSEESKNILVQST